MHCSNCGAEIVPQSSFCSHCGAPLPAQPVVPPPAGQPPPTYVPLSGQPAPGYPGGYAPPGGFAPQIPNHLVWAILTTLFCCLPFGIVAIVYSSQVQSRQLGGDYEGALAASNSAKTWCWLSFGLGLAVTLIYVVFMVAVAADNPNMFK